MKPHPHKAHRGDYEKMKKLYDVNLDETKEGTERLENFFNDFNGDPEALLFCAIDDEDVDVAIITDLILNRNISVNVAIYGTNPLLYACETGVDFDIIDSLLDLGAQPIYQIQGRSAYQIVQDRVKNGDEGWGRILAKMSSSSSAIMPPPPPTTTNKKKIEWTENTVLTIEDKGNRKLNDRISNILKVNYIEGFVEAVQAALVNEKISALDMQNKILLFAVFVNEKTDNKLLSEQMDSIRVGIIEDINKNNPRVIDLALVMASQYRDLKSEIIFKDRVAFINEDIAEALEGETKPKPEEKPVAPTPKKGILKRTSPIEEHENSPKQQRWADADKDFYEELSKLLVKQLDPCSNRDYFAEIDYATARYASLPHSDFYTIAVMGISESNNNLVKFLLDGKHVDQSTLDLMIEPEAELPSAANATIPNPIVKDGRLIKFSASNERGNSNEGSWFK